MQTPLTGTNLTRLLNEVRGMREFSIDDGYKRRRCELKAVYADEGASLAWIEAHNGVWRLPRAFVPWALEVDHRAKSLLGHTEVFPCQAVFDRMPDGSWEVEVFPGSLQRL
ncbi:hypothetical protein ACWDFH_12435 [Streptomyces kronopolitis]